MSRAVSARCRLSMQHWFDSSLFDSANSGTCSECQGNVSLCLLMTNCSDSGIQSFPLLYATLLTKVGCLIFANCTGYAFNGALNTNYNQLNARTYKALHENRLHANAHNIFGVQPQPAPPRWNHWQRLSLFFVQAAAAVWNVLLSCSGSRMERSAGECHYRTDSLKSALKIPIQNSAM